MSGESLHGRPSREEARGSPGPITRKIEISKQIEELEREKRMRLSVYPRQVTAGKLRQSEVDEAMERLEGAIATLRFCREHEHEFRAWFKTTQHEGQGA